MRRKLVVCLFLCLACAAGYWAYGRLTAPAQPDEAGPDVADGTAPNLDGRVPVPNNRGPEVVDGFRGEVHPLLHRHAQTEVNAYWVPPNVDHLDPRAPIEVRELYRYVSAAIPTKSYSERDFSGFLPPENVTTVGQLWALDPERAAVFLKQFHPAVSTHVASEGRRPGPDGAFAMLRGVSPSHLDIVFRVHAEFDLLPKPTEIPAFNAWYSPACFLGRLVVNRDEGTVEYVQFGVPTDKMTNVHVSWRGIGIRAHNTQRVNRMELIGGSLEGLDGVRWTDQIEMAQAHDKLTALFYKFKEINFLPFDQALAAARAEKKPIFAVVLLGALDDQSC